MQFNDQLAHIRDLCVGGTNFLSFFRLTHFFNAIFIDTKISQLACYAVARSLFRHLTIPLPTAKALVNQLNINSWCAYVCMPSMKEAALSYAILYE